MLAVGRDGMEGESEGIEGEERSIGKWGCSWDTQSPGMIVRLLELLRRIPIKVGRLFLFVNI